MSGDLRRRLEERLVALRSELAAGHRLLAELEERQRDVHETMLRITGAIQVLEEALADGARCEEPPPPG